MNMTEELKGKTALVTGASRGIGRATALALARQGANLVVHFNSAVASARELVTAIRAEGGDAEAVRADLSTHAGTASLASDVAALSKRKLDILVANAGITKAGSLADHILARWPGCTADALLLKSQRRANLPAVTWRYGIYGNAMTRYLRPGCKLPRFQR